MLKYLSYILAFGLCLAMPVQAISPYEGLTKKQIARHHSVAMNPDKPLASRVRAMKKLYSHILVDGKLPTRKICVWDPLGKKGPVYSSALDQKARFFHYGVMLDIEAYTSESVLVGDFKAKICDAALMTGFRARQFNKFSGSIDAFGALPDKRHLKTLLQVVTNPKFAKKMQNGAYLILGIVPIGPAHFFVSEKQITSLEKVAGKRFAVLDYDSMQASMAKSYGATPVQTSLATAGGKFNNGLIDVLPAPLVGYNMLELQRGFKQDGGILDLPFSQSTLQLVAWEDSFPPEVAQFAREDFYLKFNQFYKESKEAIGTIPDTAWIKLSAAEKKDYQSSMQNVRLMLRKKGYYDKTMLKIMRKIRCRYTPSSGECSSKKE